jgi:hypothetical protein
VDHTGRHLPHRASPTPGTSTSCALSTTSAAISARRQRRTTTIPAVRVTGNQSQARQFSTDTVAHAGCWFEAHGAWGHAGADGRSSLPRETALPLWSGIRLWAYRLGMALSSSHRRGARLLVADTGALVNEIVEGTRNGNLTSLLAALGHDAFVLYVPRHVLAEVERHLPRQAQARSRPVDPAAAVARWRTLYAPFIRVVDVPDHWGSGHPGVTAVAARHPADAPLAMLAAALADCYVLTEDPDLIDNGFGQRDRLPMLLAAANEGELNIVGQAVVLPLVLGQVLISAAWTGARGLPRIARTGLVIGAGFLVYQWHHDPRVPGQLRQVFTAVTDLAALAVPPLTEIYQRRETGRAVWEEHAVGDMTNDLSERVARVLAFSPDGGLLAGDIARELADPESIKRRTALVRAALEEHEAFVEVSRGRWRLGHAITNRRPNLPPAMVAEWLQRAHARAQPPSEPGAE